MAMKAPTRVAAEVAAAEKAAQEAKAAQESKAAEAASTAAAPITVSATAASPDCVRPEMSNGGAGTIGAALAKAAICTALAEAGGGAATKHLLVTERMWKCVSQGLARRAFLSTHGPARRGSIALQGFASRRKASLAGPRSQSLSHHERPRSQRLYCLARLRPPSCPLDVAERTAS